MSNLVLLSSKIESVESKLSRMKQLKQAMSELEAEYDMLKKSVIADYFEHNDTLINDKGLVLATYKEQLRTQFQTTEFKKHEPELYEKYLDIKPVKTFLLK